MRFAFAAALILASSHPVAHDPYLAIEDRHMLRKAREVTLQRVSDAFYSLRIIGLGQ